MKTRIYLSLLLLLATLPALAQDCYQNLQSGAGISADPARAQDAACKLRQAFPDSVQPRFKVFSGSLYRLAGQFAAGTAETLVTRLESSAAASSPYYLLVVWEAAGDNLFAKPHVRLRLPSGGVFACMDPLRRTAWQARLLLQAQGDAPRAKDPEDYLRAESKLMDELRGYVSDQVKCCKVGDNKCPTCITRREREALLKAFPFRQIGKTNYSPAALGSRVETISPAGSSSEIRDGIRTTLDLGGGPVDLGQAILQLANERPDLGLQALLVHDSLLCDPSLLPDKFLGRNKPRAVSNDVYLILQRDGNVQVLGDELAIKEVIKKLRAGVKFLKFLDEGIISGVDPCDTIISGGGGRLYMTPSGTVVHFFKKMTPIFADGNGSIVEGALQGFILDGVKYTTLFAGDDKFLAYIKFSEGERLQKITGPTEDQNGKAYNGINSNLLQFDGSGKLLKTEFVFIKEDFTIAETVLDPVVVVHFVKNGAATGYTYKVPKGRAFNGPLITSAELTISGVTCEVCTKGPGKEFYDKHYNRFKDNPDQAYQLCLVSQLINQLAKIYYEGDKVFDGKWADSDLDNIYGFLYNTAFQLGYSPHLVEQELKKVVTWIENNKNSYAKSDLIIMALASKNNDFISLIPPKVRLDLIKTIVKQPIQGPYGIFGATFNTYTSEGTLVRLFENINDADKALFFDLIDGEVEVINKLFRGFNDFEWPLTDNNYQRFYAAFLKIYKKGKKLDEAALKAQFEASDDIIYLGDVVFPKRGYFEQNSGDITITDLWSRRSLVRVEIKNLKISWKIKYPDLRNAPHLLSDSLLRANYEIVEYEPIDIFEPIGVIISKKDGTGVKNEGIQILPAFALKYWYDFEEGRKLEAAVSFVAFSALTVLSAGSYGYATGAYKVLTCIDIFATAGEVAFSAYDANHPEIWNQTKDWEEFREAWRAGTAVLVSPLAVKFMVTDGPRMVTAIVKTVAKAPRAFSQGFDNFLNRLCKLYNVARGGTLVLDPLADLFQRFKSLPLGLSDDLCRLFSKKILDNLTISPAKTAITDISDDFLRLFASSNDAGRDLLVAKFFPSSGSSKLLGFQKDLKIDDFFDLIKGDANLAKAWEALYTSLPTNLRHFARDREHLLFLQNTDVQLALAWIKSERPNLFTTYPNLTPGEIVSLCYYTTEEGYQINFFVRGLPVTQGTEWSIEHANRYLVFLNSAFAKLPTYRSSNPLLRLEWRSIAEVAGFSKGQKLNYPNYISTSKNNKNVFITGTKNEFDNTVENFILEIENPNGIKVIDLEPFSRAEKEFEALVIRGKALEIVDIEYKIFPLPTAEELVASNPSTSLELARSMVRQELNDWAISAANPNAVDAGLLIPGNPAYERAIKIRTLKVKIVE